MEEGNTAELAAAALRTSETRYRRLFEPAKDGILILDFETGRIVDVNPFMTMLLGFSHDQFLGKSIWEIGAFKDVVANREKFAELRRNDYIRYEDVPLEAADGRQIDVEFVSNVYAVDDAKVIQCNIRDITARVKAEAALRAGEHEFRALAESMPQIVWITRPDGWNTYFNQQWVDYTGLTQEESRGHGWNTPFHPSDKQHAWEAWQRAVQHGEGYAHECRLRGVSGAYRWWLIRGVPVRNAHGKLLKWFGTCTDIDDIKRTMESQARLVTAVEQAVESIVITDPAGKIEYVNPAFEKITGYAREEATGRNPRVLKSGRHDAAFYRQMWTTLAAGRVWAGRMTNRRKDGAFFEEEATISPIFDAAGRIINYVAVKRDITREVELELLMRQAQKMESIGQLAGGVAHDFNNLLLAILGYSEIVLKQTPAADPRHGDLLEIQKTGRRAAELTRQLLAVSRQQNLDRRVTDVHALIEDVSRMLRRVIGENIRIEFEAAPQLDRVLVDPGQIGQILLNLAVNARDAMPRGGRLLFKTESCDYAAEDLAAQPDIRAGRFVRVSITDTGTGLPPEVVRKLFEPFFTTKPPGKGTGLGLATSYGIARQHGGWMDAYSELGHGSSFRLYLPVTESTGEPLDICGRKEPLPPESLRGTGQHILFVEDEEVVRTMVQRQLQRNGYTVTALPNAESAFEEFERTGGNWDLVLTDVMLPDLNGLEMLDRLLSMKPGLRVLISSGYTDNEKRWPLILERKWPFIGKPYTGGELLTAIHRILAPA